MKRYFDSLVFIEICMQFTAISSVEKEVIKTQLIPYRRVIVVSRSGLVTNGQDCKTQPLFLHRQRSRENEKKTLR